MGLDIYHPLRTGDNITVNSCHINALEYLLEQLHGNSRSYLTMYYDGGPIGLYKDEIDHAVSLIDSTDFERLHTGNCFSNNTKGQVTRALLKMQEWTNKFPDEKWDMNQ